MSNNELWIPPKPESEATDREIRQSPIGSFFREKMKVDEGNIPPDVMVAIMRAAWQEAYNNAHDFPHLTDDQRKEIRDLVGPEFANSPIKDCLAQIPGDTLHVNLSFNPEDGESWDEEETSDDPSAEEGSAADDDEPDDESEDDSDDDSDDDDEDEEEDEGYEEDYTVVIPVTISLRVRTSAMNPGVAKMIARDLVKDLRFKTYHHAHTAEMIGLTDRQGVPCSQVSLDTPELIDTDNMTVEEG